MLSWGSGGLQQYRLDLKGKNFEVLNLPELQALADPDLQFEGTAELLKVRGTVGLPHLLLQRSKRREFKTVSADVLVLDAPELSRAKLPFALDARLTLVLGDRVLVAAEGVDVRLGGKLLLMAQSLEDIRAEGRIAVLDGGYVGHGVRLKIDRGSLYFGGGPVGRPNLDVLAVRKVGEVKAGVALSGTPRFPRVQLYSEPAMAETDILSYIVLGRPLDPQGGQSSLLMLAAGGLLSQGDSLVLQDRLQRTLGIDVLDIQTGDGNVADSVVLIGKYLRPNLYISLGHSLFTQTNEFKLRYDFAPQWELQSTMGIQSGVDLFYRIEFD